MYFSLLPQKNKPVAVTVYKKDFDLPRRDADGGCTKDFLKIKFIDETTEIGGKFPLDAGTEANGVKLCGSLPADQHYRSLPGAKTLVAEFRADTVENGSGFIVDFCVGA